MPSDSNEKMRRRLFRILIVLSVIWVILAAVIERVPNSIGDLWTVYRMDPETRAARMSCGSAMFLVWDEEDRAKCKRFRGIERPDYAIEELVEASKLMFGPPIAVLIIAIIGVLTNIPHQLAAKGRRFINSQALNTLTKKLWIAVVIAIPVTMWLVYLFMIGPRDYLFNDRGMIALLTLAVASSFVALWMLNGKDK